MSKDIPAFPSREIKVINDKYDRIEIPTDGMTLRDYLAGQALIGKLSRIKEWSAIDAPIYMAKFCYEYADAMLKQREVK